MNKKILFIMMIILISCSSQNGKRRESSDYFRSNGAIKYFKPDLPNWANFSQSARCSRDSSIKYLDVEMIKGNFLLSDHELAQLQLLYNHELKELAKRNEAIRMTLEEEEKLFFSSLEKNQSRIYLFVAPQYQRIHFIWVDDFIQKRRSAGALKRALDETPMSQGHPVFVSLCLGFSELNKWIQENGFSNYSAKALSYELALLRKKENGDYFFELNLESLFSKNQKLYFFSPQKNVPHDFSGKMNISNF